MLIIAARTGDDPRYLEIIDEIDRELTKVTEEFDRIVNVEAPHLANETSKLIFSQSVDSRYLVVCRRASGTRARRRSRRISLLGTPFVTVGCLRS